MVRCAATVLVVLCSRAVLSCVCPRCAACGVPRSSTLNIICLQISDLSPAQACLALGLPRNLNLSKCHGEIQES